MKNDANQIMLGLTRVANNNIYGKYCFRDNLYLWMYYQYNRESDTFEFLDRYGRTNDRGDTYQTFFGAFREAPRSHVNRLCDIQVRLYDEIRNDLCVYLLRR